MVHDEVRISKKLLQSCHCLDISVMMNDEAEKHVKQNGFRNMTI